jgi:hypothetical protein
MSAEKDNATAAREVASGTALSEVLGDHVRSFGSEVVVVVSEAALDEVGEPVLIAPRGARSAR